MTDVSLRVRDEERKRDARAKTPMDLAGTPRPFKVEVLQLLNKKKVFVQWSTFMHRENAEARAEKLKADGFVVRVLPPLPPPPRTVECVFCLGTLCDPGHLGTCLL